MNKQKEILMNQSPEKSYISHVLRYVGVGLISGSIVHAGTLGGGYTKYIILIMLGIIGFVVGTLLEKNEHNKSLISFIIISVILSIGVGMVSGGTQHYLDGPIYASLLIPLGIGTGYLAFLFRDYRKSISVKRITLTFIGMATLAVMLYYIAHLIPAAENHHSKDKELVH